MPDFQPTPEQQACVDAARKTSDNLIIRALAGAAKTSTLVLIAHAVQVPILSLAFNKKIQLEMQDRLPSHCTSKTLNGLGHQAWGQFINKRGMAPDTGKTYRLLKETIDKGLSEVDRKHAFEIFSDTMRAIDAGKTCGYIPTGQFPLAERLMDDGEFFAWLEDEPSDLQMELIRAVSILSIKEAYQGTIDFNDQILLPTVFPATFEKRSLTLVDEAQDLSALNHAMLKKVIHRRVIAVGDECQAIYGFRGAHEDSMNLLQQQFSMQPLTLSTTFRCPSEIVKEARWRAPHMQWFKEGGTVTKHGMKAWGPDFIPADAAIICRNNAPLFSMAIKLLKAGRYPELVGNDIGKNLIKTLKKLGKPDIRQAQLLIEIDEWLKAKLKKSRNKANVEDQAECLRIFARQGKTLAEAITYAEALLSQSGPIKLMTGHKSKGLEFDHVYFLDQHLLRDEGQDRNLRYVIQTRAKQTLTYINSEDFEDGTE